MKIVLISQKPYPFFIQTANYLHDYGHEIHIASEAII